jgi:hypothetical protein
MTSYEPHLDPSQPADDIGLSVYIPLAAIFLVVCSIALYAVPRDSHMIVTSNAIDRIDAMMPAAAEPPR